MAAVHPSTLVNVPFPIEGGSGHVAWHVGAPEDHDPALHVIVLLVSPEFVITKPESHW